MAHVIELKDEVYEMLMQHCLKRLSEGREMSVDKLMEEMMDYPEIPMHFPYHHFIMPAALLTLASIEEQVKEEELADMLEIAITRSKNVLGGFCGNYGTCGAAVGAGIFLSVYTDTSPLSGTSWQWVNELTGICLQNIATVPGPRCCKRTAYLSLQRAVPYINEKLDLHLHLSDKIVCKYSDRNEQCKKEECPFYETTVQGSSKI